MVYSLSSARAWRGRRSPCGGRNRRVPTLEMVHGVAAYAVSPAPHLIQKLRMTLHILAHHEEGGLDVVVVEHVEHPGRDLRYGAVVEGEKHPAVFPPFGPHLEDGSRKQGAENAWRSLYQHNHSGRHCARTSGWFFANSSPSLLLRSLSSLSYCPLALIISCVPPDS